MTETARSQRMLFSNIVDAVGHTPLVELPSFSPREGVRIFAKLEGHNPTGSVKDRIAKYMIEKAEASGELTHDRIILESTSGNTGIALAMIGRRKGYKVRVVMPDNVSVERRQLLELYGADVVLTDGARGSNGAIQVAQELGKDPKYYMPYQYGNPANPLAHYETTGVEIIEALPDVDVFVAGLGTGGTLTGTGRRLKEHNPNVKVVAAEPHTGDLVQGLRSLEEGFIPDVLDLSILDGKIVVESRESFAMVKELTSREGIFAGVSSGAVMLCALRVARRLDRGNVVALMADGGWKYLSTNLWTTDTGQIDDETYKKIWW